MILTMNDEEHNIILLCCVMHFNALMFINTDDVATCKTKGGTSNIHHCNINV